LSVLSGFVQKAMLRRTRIFLLLVAVAIATIWYRQRVVSTTSEAKPLTVRFQFKQFIVVLAVNSL